MAVGDVFFLTDAIDVHVDGLAGHLQIFGDLEVGPAVGQARQHLPAHRRLAMEVADEGFLSLGDEGGGFGDFEDCMEEANSLVRIDGPIRVGAEVDKRGFVAGDAGAVG